jgi:hypothetical protein
MHTDTGAINSALGVVGIHVDEQLSAPQNGLAGEPWVAAVSVRLDNGSTAKYKNFRYHRDSWRDRVGQAARDGRMYTKLTL